MKRHLNKSIMIVSFIGFIFNLLTAGTHENQSANNICRRINKELQKKFCEQSSTQSSGSKQLNILFDSWSTQVLFQKAPGKYPAGVFHPTPTGQRLNTILGAMKSIGLSTGVEWNVFFTKTRVTKRQLEKMDVYVSLTRFINIPNPPKKGIGFSYSDSELSALEEFVRRGGGILLMSDHGQLPPSPTFPEGLPNFTANDVALAQRFGVTLMNIFVSNSDNFMVMEMNPDLPANSAYLAYQVNGLAAHDSCIMLPPNDFTPLVMFPAGVTAFDSAINDFIPLPSPYFAILVPFGAGNVIIVGNSGMVGDWGSPAPAAGLVPLENNLMFFLNCVGYLGGLRCIPPLGFPPCAL